jgi:hypothetical protein
MTSHATRVVIHEHNRMAVLREHGRRSYFPLVDRPVVEKTRNLKRPQRSLAQAKLYRARVLVRLARGRQYERSLGGRLHRLGKAIRELNATIWGMFLR